MTTQPPTNPYSGRLGHLTPSEQRTLDDFRTLLSNDPDFPWDPKRHDDANLLRWLRALKFKLVATKADEQGAKEMIYAAEKWRKEFGVDQIVKEFEFPEKEEVNKYYPQYYHKTDKDGRPLYIEVISKSLDINKLYAVTTEDRLLRRLVLEYERFEQERLPICTSQLPPGSMPVETSCTILDMSGFSLPSFYRVKDFIGKASAIGQNYYPERMGKFYIINTPYFFSTAYAVVKLFLDPITREKIAVLSTKEVWEVGLLKQIPKENLPVEFGGTCTCEGLGGCEMSDAGPWNPKTNPDLATHTTSALAPAPAVI